LTSKIPLIACNLFTSVVCLNLGALFGLIMTCSINFEDWCFFIMINLLDNWVFFDVDKYAFVTVYELPLNTWKNCASYLWGILYMWIKSDTLIKVWLPVVSALQYFALSLEVLFGLVMIWRLVLLDFDWIFLVKGCSF
jgi:hypothetical protein